MEALYASLGHWSPNTLEGLWQKWLWECDCNAPPLEQCCDMNKMHVLGLLCCLGESIAPVAMAQKCINWEIIPDLPVVHLHPSIPISSFSLRELFDQLECLQLHWGPILSLYFQSQQKRSQPNADGCSTTTTTTTTATTAPTEQLENDSDEDVDEDGSSSMPASPLEIIKALMARLGVIAHHAYPTDGVVLDDPQHTTPLPISASLFESSNGTTATHTHQTTTDIFADNNNNNNNNNNEGDASKSSSSRLSIILRKSLRQAICIMFSLLRVQSILSRCIQPPIRPLKELQDISAALKQHHIEASMDLFGELQQMTHLAPGMRLVYRTNFTGMYNHVSQVRPCSFFCTCLYFGPILMIYILLFLSQNR